MADRFLRPPMEVLGDEALVPAPNLIQPPPNRFTHRIVAETPFWFGSEKDGDKPSGLFKAGTEVVLLLAERGRCRVVDGQGVYAEVPADSLVERSSD